MRVIQNDKAIYLIFETGSEEIQHSADELYILAEGIEKDEEAVDLFRELFKAYLTLKRMISGNHQEGKSNERIDS